MEKKFVVIFSMLFASSVNVKAVNIIRVQMPVELSINIQDPNNPHVEFLNIKSDLNSGSKWVMLPQVAAMFDPQNPNKVALLDVKRTILKIIVKNPEIIQRAGINPEDFINAGYSASDVRKMQAETLSKEEIGLAYQILNSQILNDLLNGDSGKGLGYLWGGSLDFLKGGAKFGFGTAILLKKAAVATVKFLKDWFDDVTESEKEAHSSID